MAAGQLAYRAVAQAWLCPSAPRLVALAEGAAVLDDPAFALLAVRFARPSPTIDGLDARLLHQSSILEAAAAFLDSGGWASHRVIDAINRYGLLIAERAESLAALSGAVNPAAARLAGLLAPLGWLALAIVDADAIDATLKHEDYPNQPQEHEEAAFGLSVDAVMRRLSQRWKLPAWLTNALGTLRLPVADAVALGADRELAKVLRFAIRTVEARHGTLGLLGPVTAVADWQVPEQVEETRHGVSSFTPPCQVPLLKTLLITAATAKRHAGASRLADLESQVDSLQTVLRRTRQDFDRALRDAKLEAVAELAAGAGHEINNPLAVISGNAQLLKAREEDPERRKGLDTIIRQAGRVADLLQDLMQFARPAKPQSRIVPLADLLAPVLLELKPAAEAKSVNLRQESIAGLVEGDLRQLRRAVANLVKNAIDATPAGGFVRVAAGRRGNSFRILVEDTGPGPSDEAVPHLFDPFYSGRSAGRGRGLGLSTALAYAKQNGGDLEFARTEDGRTRFTLSLPAVEAEAGRQSA